jgi:hypothetical protein
MTGSTVAHKAHYSSQQIPVLCSYLNTSESYQPNEVSLDLKRFVLYTKKPFQVGSLLFVRVQSFPRRINNCATCTVVRSSSIMEVKWCRKTDAKTDEHTYEIGVVYLQPYAVF